MGRARVCPRRRQGGASAILLEIGSNFSVQGSQVLYSNRLVQSGWAVYFALMLFFNGMITGFIIKVLHVCEVIKRKEKDGN